MPAKILIVEDEVIVADTLANDLEKLGYEICGTVISGEKAIELTKEIQPDLVLMDIVLKGKMDGIEAAHIIRANWNIPVIFITAYDDDKRLNRAKLHNPLGYILKPYRDRELKVTIKIALHMARMEKLRKDAEDALLISEARYRAIFENAAIGVCHTDLEGKFLRVNKALCEIWGYSEEELFGKDFSLVNHPEFTNKDLEIINRLLTGEIDTHSSEKQYIRKNGSTIWGNFSISLARDKDGCPDFFVAIIDNITQRKLAEFDLIKKDKELKRKNKKLEELNTAFKVLLEQREAEKLQAETNFVESLGKLALPYLERLEQTTLSDQQRIYISILKKNLDSISSTITTRLNSGNFHLTPSETLVADLIKQGYTNKEIADILRLAPATISSFRKRIREKLGLVNKKVNLRSYLLHL